MGLEIRPLANQNCHWNVSDSSLINLEGYRIAHGYALGSDDLWHCHSWGILDRHIIETCPLSGKARDQYFGFIFPRDVNVNATHGGLGDELERVGEFCREQ